MYPSLGVNERIPHWKRVAHNPRKQIGLTLFAVRTVVSQLQLFSLTVKRRMQTSVDAFPRTAGYPGAARIASASYEDAQSTLSNRLIIRRVIRRRPAGRRALPPALDVQFNLSRINIRGVWT